MSAGFRLRASWIESGAEHGPDLPPEGRPFVRAQEVGISPVGYVTAADARRGARRWVNRQTATDGCTLTCLAPSGEVAWSADWTEERGWLDAAPVGAG